MPTVCILILIAIFFFFFFENAKCPFFSGTVLLTNAHVQPGRRQSSVKVRVAHHGENRPLGRPLPSPDDNVLTPDQGPGLVYESSTRPPLAGKFVFFHNQMLIF